jgi:hypothetical protein
LHLFNRQPCILLQHATLTLHWIHILFKNSQLNTCCSSGSICDNMQQLQSVLLVGNPVIAVSPNNAAIRTYHKPEPVNPANRTGRVTVRIGNPEGQEYWHPPIMQRGNKALIRPMTADRCLPTTISRALSPRIVPGKQTARHLCHRR